MVRVGDLTIQDQAVILPQIFVGSTTRDISLASGTQAITGVGFKPRYVHFSVCLNATDAFSTGHDSNTGARKCAYILDKTAGLFYVDTSLSIVVYSSANNGYLGYISSFDVDGFTITWQKWNSSTGTAQIAFTAFK